MVVNANKHHIPYISFASVLEHKITDDLVGAWLHVCCIADNAWFYYFLAEDSSRCGMR